jgi:hypothetical protein
VEQVVRTETQETGQALRFQEAYDRMLPEIRAVDPSDLVPLNIDVQTAYTTVIGALPNLRSVAADIQAAVIGFDPKSLDQLEDYARALASAHAICNMASTPTESLPALAQAGAEIRENLLNDATALARRRLIDGERLKALKGPVGYRNLGFDLLELSTLLRSNWKAIENKTPVQLSELDEAQTMADRLLSAVGEREQSRAVVAEVAKIRHQAFSLLVKAYDQARRAVQFVRWNGDDAEDVAPSLYAARAAGRRKNGSDVKAASADSPAAAASAAAAQPATAVAPVGLPGSSPFVAP